MRWPLCITDSRLWDNAFELLQGPGKWDSRIWDILEGVGKIKSRLKKRPDLDIIDRCWSELTMIRLALGNAELVNRDVQSGPRVVNLIWFQRDTPSRLTIAKGPGGFSLCDEEGLLHFHEDVCRKHREYQEWLDNLGKPGARISWA